MLILIRGFFHSFDLVLAFVIFLFFVFFLVNFFEFHIIGLLNDMFFVKSFFQSFVFSELAVKKDSFGFAYFDISEKRVFPNIVLPKKFSNVGFDSNSNCFSFKRIVRPVVSSSKFLVEIPFCG